MAITKSNVGDLFVPSDTNETVRHEKTTSVNLYVDMA
jgi:hypothetical protein